MACVALATWSGALPAPTTGRAADATPLVSAAAVTSHAGRAARAVASPGTCTYPATQNQVLVVIDFGTVPGVEGTRPAQGVTTFCVVASDRSNGVDALYAALGQVGWSARTEASMLCAIAGYPASDCGKQTGDTYQYWSYWWGENGTWSYASTGPKSTRTRCTRVEGWRFIDGKKQVGGQDYPRGSALARNMCAPTPQAPGTTNPPAPTVAPNSPVVPPGQPGSPQTQAGFPGAPSATSTIPGTSTTVAGGGATSGAERPDPDSGQATAERRRVEGAWADVQTPAQRRAATAVDEAPASSGSALLQLVVGVVLLAGLAVLGAVQVRRRRLA